MNQIINDLLNGAGNSDKENQENEGKRDIACLGEFPSGYE
jgi:hypothetical protein